MGAVCPAVKAVRGSAEKEEEYMVLEAVLMDERRYGKKEGVQLSAKVIQCINNGTLLNQEIARDCGCPVEDVESIRKAFGV